MKVYPFKIGSKSATLLAQALGVKKVFADRNFHPKSNELVINWGSSRRPNWHDQNGVRILNKPEAVARAVNKLTTLNILRQNNIRTVEFTTDREVASKWGEIMVRKTLTGHSGIGAEYVANGEILVLAPLYTKYVPKAREYRLHVFNGRIIDIQQKKRRNETESNDHIKNLGNGWVYCHDNITPLPESNDTFITRIEEDCLNAINALGLDFGAVDVLVKDRLGYILEVNCAVGISGRTLEIYKNAIETYATN